LRSEGARLGPSGFGRVALRKLLVDALNGLLQRFVFACVWTALSALVAATLGASVFIAAIARLLLAWAYCAPPLRLKQNGWWGIAVKGDTDMGVRSLPVQFGVARAAWVACTFMAAPQCAVIALLLAGTLRRRGRHRRSPDRAARDDARVPCRARRAGALVQ